MKLSCLQPGHGSLARAQTALAIRTLTGVCGSKGAPAAARVSAASGLLDRGWGKAPQPHTGEDDNRDNFRAGSRHVAKRRIHPLGCISLRMTVSEPQALEADRPR
jgi:hypothetical protein